MKILHVLLCRGPFPAFKFGGTERVVWSLANAQIKQGHEVKFLMRPHQERPESTIFYDKKKSFNEQVTEWPDIVHFHLAFNGELDKPFVCTEHANADEAKTYATNTIFISERHAQNHNSNCYVYNGLDWDEYGRPNLTSAHNYLHFLGKATIKHKNLKGAAYVAKQSGYPLSVLGGKRLELGKNGYINFDSNLSFKGMTGGADKFNTIKNSKALLFPVRWHEPFGLAITESLFLGTPVIGTPYGSLPEIITDRKVGLLADNYEEMIDAANNVSQFSRAMCHEIARDLFNADVMEKKYFSMYEKVLSGYSLNSIAPYTEQNLMQKLLLITDKKISN